MKFRILLVEDENLVGTMVRMNLESEGFEVVWCRDGNQGLQTGCEQRFDLVLLDIGLPGIDGIEVLKGLRERGIGTPVLMLTARSDVLTKIKTLEHGADDYLPKPFDVNEMVARAQALIRRSQAEREIPSDNVLRFGPYEINLETREARTNEGAATLSEKEAAFLRLLVQARGQVLRRSDILEGVWGMEVSPTERTVDNFVLRLRKLFEPDPNKPRHIVTVRGIGYRFVP